MVSRAKQHVCNNFCHFMFVSVRKNSNNRKIVNRVQFPSSDGTAIIMKSIKHIAIWCTPASHRESRRKSLKWVWVLFDLCFLIKKEKLSVAFMLYMLVPKIILDERFFGLLLLDCCTKSNSSASKILFVCIFGWVHKLVFTHTRASSSNKNWNMLCLRVLLLLLSSLRFSAANEIPHK